jgi:hypothetical protein
VRLIHNGNRIQAQGQTLKELGIEEGEFFEISRKFPSNIHLFISIAFSKAM